MEKAYRISSPLSKAIFEGESLADVELFREGSWKHPGAPGGWFDVTKEKIRGYINNFNKGVAGPELPLEFSHTPDSKNTPGWITKLYEKIQNGVSGLWATLKLTDSEVAKRIKDGSLKYISPTVVSGYIDTATGQEFEVIRSATLTNYPHIKNLNPISVNFEEIREKEENMSEQDILKKNDLQLEDLESVTLETMENDVDLEYLTEDQIVKLAEKFEMTADQFQEKYPTAGKNMYGNRPKIKCPAGVPADRKKEFFQIFNAMYDKYKDVDKATAAAIRKLGIKLEEDPKEQGAVKMFVEKVISTLEKAVGKDKKIVTEEEGVDSSKFEELTNEVKELRAFKDKAEFAEDKAIVTEFKNLTPAASKILLTLLTTGRRSRLEFEDVQISVHDLVVKLFEELKSSPKTNLFEIKSEVSDLDLSENLEVTAKKYLKEHPDASWKVCLQEAYKILHPAINREE